MNQNLIEKLAKTIHLDFTGLDDFDDMTPVHQEFFKNFAKWHFEKLEPFIKVLEEVKLKLAEHGSGPGIGFESSEDQSIIEKINKVLEETK